MVLRCEVRVKVQNVYEGVAGGILVMLVGEGLLCFDCGPLLVARGALIFACSLHAP